MQILFINTIHLDLNEVSRGLFERAVGLNFISLGIYFLFTVAQSNNNTEAYANIFCLSL